MPRYNFNPVKGTHDVIGAEANAYAEISNLFAMVAENHGFQPIQTPVLEHTEVFDRSSGDSSDVVRKEMYTFDDKAGRSITLRPEGTAGVMRAIVSNKLYATPDLPLKFHYACSAYRYERPQLGRYREFRQLGVECVGEDSVLLDVEIISLAYRFLSELGFQNLKIKINTLGDKESRANYKEALKAYFSKHIDSMCEDCKQRLQLNPMRILDCKVPEDQEIVAGAPKIADYLTEASKKRYEETLRLLEALEIPYEEKPTLVRGLDYYGEVVFEIACLSPEGKDYGAICGGGHYEGILSAFDGPNDIDVGVGFGMGLERVYSLMKDFGLLNGMGLSSEVYVMPLGEDVMETAFLLATSLREAGFATLMPYKPGKLGSYFKKAERAGARFAVLLGEEEVQKDVVQVKNLLTQKQEEVAIENLIEYLDDLLQEEKGE